MSHLICASQVKIKAAKSYLYHPQSRAHFTVEQLQIESSEEGQSGFTIDATRDSPMG
jgi:hypothetical protein